MFNYETFDRCFQRTYNMESSRYVEAAVGSSLAGHRVLQFYTGQNEDFVILGALVSGASDPWYEWAVYEVSVDGKRTILTQVTPYREFSFAHSYFSPQVKNLSQLVAIDRCKLHTDNYGEYHG